MNPPKILGLSLLCVLGILGQPLGGSAQPAVPQRVEKLRLTTDGYGDFRMDKTREQRKQEAIADAERKALERAWTTIQSHPKVKNAAVVVELIAPKTSGVVRVLRIQDFGLEGTRYHVRIDAEVHYAFRPAAGVERPTAGLAVEVGFLFEGSDGKPYPLRNGMVLYSNDHYAIYFKPNQPCYIYIVQQDSTGKMYLLFPNPAYGTATNPVSQDTAYWVPSKDTWFYLDENIGKEWLYIIASTTPPTSLESVAPRGTTTLMTSKEDFSEAIKTMGPAGVRASSVSKVHPPGKGEVDVLREKVSTEKSQFMHTVWFWHRAAKGGQHAPQAK